MPRKILLTTDLSESYLRPMVHLPDRRGKRGCIPLYISFSGMNVCRNLTGSCQWGNRTSSTARTHIQCVQRGKPSVVYFPRESCFSKSTKLACKLTCQYFRCMIGTSKVYLSQRVFLPLCIVHKIDTGNTTRQYVQHPHCNQFTVQSVHLVIRSKV